MQGCVSPRLHPARDKISPRLPAVLPTMPASTSHPFASPNAIPPRTSSTGILSLNGNSVKHRNSVLRPLSETNWLGQSKKSKTSHSAEPLNAFLHQPPPHRDPLQTMDSPNVNSTSNASPQAMDTESSTLRAEPSNPLEISTSYPSPLSQSADHAQTKGMGEDLINGNGLTWTSQKERILLGPYDYLFGHPGKDIRSQCIAAFNLWLKVPQERLEVITRVVGMLHTASLLYVSITLLEQLSIC